MAKRMKKPVISGVSREMAEQAFAQYAKSQACLKKMQAEIELQCTRIREKYQDAQADLNHSLGEAFLVLEAFAREHPEEFGKKKSLPMAHGIIGWRTGMPQFKTERGFTQQAVIALIKDAFPLMADRFVARKESLNKEAIIAATRLESGSPDAIDPDELRSRCHAWVEQEEAFFVEAKSEETDD